MMKFKNILPIVGFILVLSSCLEYNLPELPVFEEAEIIDFKIEFRYYDTADKSLVAKVVSVPAVFDTTTAAIEVALSSSSSVKKLATERDMTMQNIVGYATISSGATIYPKGGAPKLGVPTDWSGGSFEYEVVAADEETKKVWVVNVTPFNF